VKHQHFDRHTNPLENEIYKTQRDAAAIKTRRKRAKSLSAELRLAAKSQRQTEQKNKEDIPAQYWSSY